MSKFKFGEFETEIDVSDFDFMDKYESLAEKMGQEVKKLPKDGKVSEIIKNQCIVAFKFFDGLFGDNTSNTMFGGKVNARTVDSALVTLADAIKADRIAYTEESKASATKIVGNREQRRSTKKK